jgi:hypothetical protein
LRAAAQLEGTDCDCRESGYPGRRRGTEQDRHVVRPRLAFQARRDVDRITDRRIVGTVVRAENADRAESGVDSEAGVEPRLFPFGPDRVGRD